MVAEVLRKSRRDEFTLPDALAVLMVRSSLRWNGRLQQSPRTLLVSDLLKSHSVVSRVENHNQLFNLPIV
jgi:hypothetical protein